MLPVKNSYGQQPAANGAAASSENSNSDVISRATIDALKTKIDAQADLAEADKTAALSEIQKAVNAISSTELLTSQRNADQDALSKVEQTRQQLDTELKRIKAKSPANPSSEEPLSQLESERVIKETELAEANKQFESAKKTVDDLPQKRKAAEDRVVAIPTEKPAIETAIAALPDSPDADLLTQAKRLALLAESKRLDAELAAKQSELALMSSQKTAGVYELRRDIASQNVETLKREVQRYTAAVNDARKSELEKRIDSTVQHLEDARKISKPWGKQLVAIHEKNLQLLNDESKLQLKLEEKEKVTASKVNDRESFEDDLEEIQNREGRTGARRRLGILLRQHRKYLPDVSSIEREIRDRAEEYEAVQLYYFDRREERNQLENIDRFVDAVLPYDANQIDLSDDESTAILIDRIQLANALQEQQENLNRVIKACDRYIEQLGKLDAEQVQLAQVCQTFAEYVDQRVLWIPSHEALRFRDLTSDVESLRVFANLSNWSHVALTLNDDFWSHVFIYCLFIVAWGLLLVSQSRQTRKIQQAGKKAASRLNTSMTPTVRSLIMTLGKTCILPIPVLFLGWRLHSANVGSVAVSNPLTDRTIAFAENLLLVGWGLFGLELVRNVHRQKGLGPSHFNWPADSCQIVSRQVNSFILIIAPLMLIIAILAGWDQNLEAEGVSQQITATDNLEKNESAGHDEVITKLGRLTFTENRGETNDPLSRESEQLVSESDAFLRIVCIAAYIFIAVLLHRLLNHKTGAIKSWVEQHSSGWSNLFASLGHLVAVIIPIAMAVLTAIGYAYAAEKLAIKFCQMVGMLFGLVFLRSLLLRWLAIRQRRLAIEQARQARAALAQQPVGSIPSEMKSTVPDVNDDQEKLAQVSIQTKRLLNTSAVIFSLIASWWIWTDVLPALHFFDNWTLPGTELKLPNMVAAIVIAVLTATAARNIPGLITITLLEWLPLEKSSRYAISAVVQYLIAIIGLLAVGERLGIGWERIQWLAAALTVGLGFGLQEIFANFVSGLIILFEQPVRVGDVVTIDGVSGVVNRIRIRATTITDWDRKEYVVPNREFITGKLLNWTLSDTTNRIVITVGVSYGADPVKVQSIILNVARAHSFVLKDPEPVVTFDGFGDSSLNFTLRAYLPSLDGRLQTVHDLHVTINQEFNTAGIEIPYPQRDLHIRSAIDIPIADAKNKQLEVNTLSPTDVENILDEATDSLPDKQS